MASIVGICNEALLLIGEESITALSENSDAARLCNLIYEPTRDALIEGFDWKFAIKRKALAQTSNTPVSGYSYEYALPNDYSRILDAEESYYEYRIEDKLLLTDQDSFKARYIAIVSDPNKMTPMFRQLLSARIAMKVAIPLTENRGRYNDVKDEFLRLQREAYSIGSFEDSAKTIESSSWTDVRI